jgi:AraC-like DNA-binding protein
MAQTPEHVRRVAVHAEVRLPHEVVDYRGAPAFHTMCDDSSAITEMTYFEPPERFAARIATFHLSSALLLQARMPKIQQDRSPLRVARSGIDHYFIVLYLRGHARQWIGARELAMRPGDIGVVDLSYPGRTLIVPDDHDRFARFLTLVLPRSALAPLLVPSDAIGQQLIRGDSVCGRILRGLLLELGRSTARIGLAETEPVIRAAATLVAGGVHPQRGEPVEDLAVVRAATTTAIRNFIERMATSPERLTTAALCRRFGVSRATIYRMFEPHGGLVHYIRDCQLRSGLQVLLSPAHRRRRIVDIALQHGFANESSFIRAFRRRFGLTPGEVRAEIDACPLASTVRSMQWLMALIVAPSR